MGVDEQETVGVAGARMTAAAQLVGRETDEPLAYLIERADALASHADNPRAEAELERVVALIEAYPPARCRAGRGR